MRCLLAVLGLVLCLGCSRGRPSTADDAPSFRLAVVTDLKGYLEPCGCTSNPLGGIDRLAAQIKTLRSDGTPLVLLVAGDVFYDTGSLEPARVDQANRNATTLAGILNLIGANAVLPGDKDRAQPVEVLTKLRAESEFPWLAMSDDTELIPIELGAHRLAIVGVRPGAEPAAVEPVVGQARGSSDVRIVLIAGTRRDANRIGAIEGVDFVIHGGLDQDAPIPPREMGGSSSFHAGRQGQGLTVVDVYRKKNDEAFVDRSEWSRVERARRLDGQIQELAAKIERWEASGDIEAADLEPQRARLVALRRERASLDAPAVQADGNAFVARWIELPKNAPRDRQVETRMREHDKAVNQANKVAFAGLKPPPLGPDDIAYVGSAACSGCHQEAYAWWRNHSHGVAYLTLQQRNKEFNLDCVGCHVTGYEQPGGSTVTHNLDGALVDVGCESCHGPGEAHTKNPEVPILRDTPESTCVVCHNEQHSDMFEYEAYVKTLVVPGHGRPVPGR